MGIIGPKYSDAKLMTSRLCMRFATRATVYSSRICIHFLRIATVGSITNYFDNRCTLNFFFSTWLPSCMSISLVVLTYIVSKMLETIEAGVSQTLSSEHLV